MAHRAKSNPVAQEPYKGIPSNIATSAFLLAQDKPYKPKTSRLYEAKRHLAIQTQMELSLGERSLKECDVPIEPQESDGGNWRIYSRCSLTARKAWLRENERRYGIIAKPRKKDISEIPRGFNRALVSIPLAAQPFNYQQHAVAQFFHESDREYSNDAFDACAQIARASVPSMPLEPEGILDRNHGRNSFESMGSLSPRPGSFEEVKKDLRHEPTRSNKWTKRAKASMPSFVHGSTRSSSLQRSRSPSKRTNTERISKHPQPSRKRCQTCAVLHAPDRSPQITKTTRPPKQQPTSSRLAENNAAPISNHQCSPKAKEKTFLGLWKKSNTRDNTTVDPTPTSSRALTTSKSNSTGPPDRYVAKSVARKGWQQKAMPVSTLPTESPSDDCDAALRSKQGSVQTHIPTYARPTHTSTRRQERKGSVQDVHNKPLGPDGNEKRDEGGRGRRSQGMS